MSGPRATSLPTVALLALLACAFAGVAEAQLIGISNTRGLAFGELVASATSGTAVVSPAGARTLTGGVTPGNSGGVTSASFTVTGIPLLTFAITLQSSTSIAAGGNSMTVNTFTSTPSGSGQLGVLGSQTLTVGATLVVGTSQASGPYTGTFSVTVVYN